jgi:hypothetical protein
MWLEQHTSPPGPTPRVAANVTSFALGEAGLHHDAHQLVRRIGENYLLKLYAEAVLSRDPSEVVAIVQKVHPHLSQTRALNLVCKVFREACEVTNSARLAA